MSINKHLHKSIVAALLVGVWISTPLAAQTSADNERLNLLFEQLLEAEPGDAERIQGQIDSELSKSGSAAMDLLLRRGEDALESGDPNIAVEHFTALVDHAPDFAEGYNGRAAAYYQLGLYGPAIDDLRQTLVIEPRHVAAMSGVAFILEELERVDDALEVWEHIQSISPADSEATQMIERLNVMRSGESL